MINKSFKYEVFYHDAYGSSYSLGTFYSGILLSKFEILEEIIKLQEFAKFEILEDYKLELPEGKLPGISRIKDSYGRLLYVIKPI